MEASSDPNWEYVSRRKTIYLWSNFYSETLNVLGMGFPKNYPRFWAQKKVVAYATTSGGPMGNTFKNLKSFTFF